ncbi:hypothetical protein N7474_000576 [Penicillium riverlandense]|uniref:uncharacterized protein n=1 Tax=Penicillium riverlandense TaxID=1903569 RepID=UPI002547E71B|nr:uncharacterized protein N7474_000576 [Penicillium riverlandense]KAJ5832265.1 hypothetical protein N7474_000576 [Penicillium riverlandense]
MGRLNNIFAVLPGPVLGMVLVQLEDLASLHNLYRASSTVFSLLHEEGTASRIIEAIIERCLPRETQILIRNFAFLRWNTHAPSSVDTLIEQYVKNSSNYVHELPRELPLSILCDIMAAAATVRYLAHTAMHEMIDRCRELELFRLENPRLKYIRNAHRTAWIRNSEYFPVPKAPRERYQQVDVGPPSALEEQRAIRALWQLLIAWELHSATTSRWRWPPSEVERLQDLNIEVWKYALQNWILEQIRTMADLRNGTANLAVPFMKRLLLTMSMTGALHSCSRGYSFVLTSLSSWYTSPLRYVDFRVFRRFGIAIWDHRRMEGLGLLSGYPGSNEFMFLAPQSEADQYVRWKSFLSADVLEEVERKRKHYWPGIEIVSVQPGMGFLVPKEDCRIA